MFLEEGIKAVRMDDIAARLGVSKRTLYEMFGDKRDLLEQAVIHHYAAKREALIEQTSKTNNVFEEIFMLLSTMKREERDATMIGNLKKFYPEILANLEERARKFTWDEFNRLLDRGIAEGLFVPDMNKELVLMTLVYTTAAIFDKKHRLAPAHTGMSMQAAFEYVIINFFRGLATRKGIEVIDELAANYKQNQNQPE